MEGGRRWPVIRCLRFRISFCFFLHFAQVAVVGMEMLKCRRRVKYEVWLKSPITWEWVFLLAESGPRKLIWRKLCQRLLPFLRQKWFEVVNSRIVSLLAASGLWNLIWTNLKLSRKNVVPDSLLFDCKTNSQRQINKILQMEYQLQFDLKLINFS